MNKLIILGFVLAIAGCTPTIQVSQDYDKQADFARYKTYAFTKSALNLDIDQLNRDRILHAVEANMAAKGFTKSDNPDALVDLTVKAVQKTDAYATSSGPGMYGPWGYGYGAGFTTTQINYDTYVVGTLFITLVDKSTEKIFWQGRATKVVEPDASAEKREANINSAVSRVFALYPPGKK